MLDHQEADGCWGGIQPPWVYYPTALHNRPSTPDHLAREVGGEGDRSELAQLLAYLSECLRGSRVDALETEWGEPSGAYDGFGVGYVRS